MSRIYDIANDLVEKFADLDPVAATRSGIPGHDAEMTDLSPEGVEARADLYRRTVAALPSAPVENERDRIARDVMLERIGVTLAMHDAGELYYQLRTLGSPMAGVRSVFDQMPRGDATQWANIASRLNKIPEALAGHLKALDDGRSRGMTVARRQVEECARQAFVWSGESGAPSFFSSILADFSRAGIDNAALQADVERGVQAADRAFSEYRRYLLDTYLPDAVVRDGSGSERYALCAQLFLGAQIDLNETYA
jgi:uncharacterized protein (DUF885 family)